MFKHPITGEPISRRELIELATSLRESGPEEYEHGYSTSTSFDSRGNVTSTHTPHYSYDHHPGANNAFQALGLNERHNMSDNLARRVSETATSAPAPYTIKPGKALAPMLGGMAGAGAGAVIGKRIHPGLAVGGAISGAVGGAVLASKAWNAANKERYKAEDRAHLEKIAPKVTSISQRVAEMHKQAEEDPRNRGYLAAGATAPVGAVLGSKAGSGLAKHIAAHLGKAKGTRGHINFARGVGHAVGGVAGFAAGAITGGKLGTDSAMPEQYKYASEQPKQSLTQRAGNAAAIGAGAAGAIAADRFTGGKVVGTAAKVGAIASNRIFKPTGALTVGQRAGARFLTSATGAIVGGGVGLAALGAAGGYAGHKVHQAMSKQAENDNVEAAKNMATDMAFALPASAAGVGAGLAAKYAIQNKSVRGMGRSIVDAAKNKWKSKSGLGVASLPFIGYEAGGHIGSFFGRRHHIESMQHEGLAKQAETFLQRGAASRVFGSTPGAQKAMAKWKEDASTVHGIRGTAGYDAYDNLDGNSYGDEEDWHQAVKAEESRLIKERLDAAGLTAMADQPHIQPVKDVAYKSPIGTAGGLAVMGSSLAGMATGAGLAAKHFKHPAAHLAGMLVGGTAGTLGAAAAHRALFNKDYHKAEHDYISANKAESDRVVTALRNQGYLK